jgi:hypothetical protein
VLDDRRREAMPSVGELIHAGSLPHGLAPLELRFRDNAGAPGGSPRFNENQGEADRAEEPPEWDANDAAMPAVASAPSDETGAQILQFEKPQEAEAHEPGIREDNLVIPGTTAMAAPSVEPNGGAIADPERREAQGSNIVALTSTAAVLPSQSDGEEGEEPEPRRTRIIRRASDRRDDPEQFARPRSLSESLTPHEKEIHGDMSSEERESVSQTMKRIAGSTDPDFNLVITSQVLNTVPKQNDEEIAKRHISGAFAAMRGIAPQDETEGMLAAQMVGLHNVAMEFLWHTIRENTPFNERREYTNLAIKLSRAFNHSCETLNRLRGKAPPCVNVGHVNVAGGAQAIVGVVNGSDRGPGKDAPDTEPGSIEHEPGAPVWRENPERQALPSASGVGEGQMQNARRCAG